VLSLLLGTPKVLSRKAMTSNVLAISFGRGSIAVGYLILGLYARHMFIRHWRIIRQLCRFPSRLFIASHRPESQDSTKKEGGFSECFFPWRTKNDLCEKKIQELAMKQRIFLHEHVLGFILHIAVMLLIVFVFIRTLEVLDSGYKGHGPSSDPITLSGFIAIVGIVVAANPGILTARRMDFFHVLLMARLMWQALATSCVHTLVFRNHGMTACRIAVGLWNGNLPLILILNLLYSCANSWKYISLMKSCAYCAEEFGPLSQVWYIMDSVFVTLVVTTFAYSMEIRTLKEARALVQAKLSSQSETTVNTLLMALCDSVIRLCGDFRITSGARSLEALLLKTNGSLNTANFLDVLEDSDRVRFYEHIQGNQKMGDDSPAALLHVHARDSNGTRVSLQIFTAHFTDLNDHVGHLLGVLELSREEYGLPEGVDLNNQNLNMLRQLPLNGSAMPSPSTTSASFLPLARPGETPDEVAIWFDAANLNVLQTTPGCTTMAGPSCAGTDLNDWLVNPSAFIEQVRAYCQKLVDLHLDDASGVPVMQIQGVKLQPPIAKKAQIEYLVDIILSVDEEDLSDSDSQNRLVLRADFKNISQRRRKKKREAQVSFRTSRRSSQDTQHDVECTVARRNSIDGQETEPANNLSL